MPNDSAIFLFNHALRLKDNPLLNQAFETHTTVVPLYIHDTYMRWNPGSASQWWLHHSLKSLQESLQAYNMDLILRTGHTKEVLTDIIKETGASTVYTTYQIRHFHDAICQVCDTLGVRVEKRHSHTLLSPENFRNKSGSPYKVFTPFWRQAQQEIDITPPVQPPEVKKNSESKKQQSDSLDDWNLLPSKPNWAKEFGTVWTPGEEGARQQLLYFLDQGVEEYKKARDFPAMEKTSRLSPHLHFGEISPRQVFYAVQYRLDAKAGTGIREGAESFLRELGWREFCLHLLYHFPDMPEKGMNSKFDDFSWKTDAKSLKAWQRGQTGLPLVDAGMRQLWQTGWMHNRVRMVVGSFLVKNLRIHWQEGEKWFWDTLVDADLANNAAGWQWVAGCGADAAPYFRIFNPLTQSKRFDAKGTYIREFVPELANLPDKYIHAPWEAPKDVLKKAGIDLGKNYPLPLVDLKQSRQDALDAYAQLS